MAVTRTLQELSADLRLSDGSIVAEGGAGIVVRRIDATARLIVESFAPTAPDAIHNEAYVRLSAWLYDADPSGQTPGGPKGLTASGAAALLAPYRVRRAVRVEGEAEAEPLSEGQVSAEVEAWALQGTTIQVPRSRLRNALTPGEVEAWALEGDNTLIPAAKLPEPTSTHYLGAYDSLTANQRAGIEIGQVVLRYNKFWIARSASATSNGPLDNSSDGWRPLNDQFRGNASTAAREYKVSDTTLVSGDLYFCTQAGSFTSTQIVASSHWINLTAGGESGGLNQAEVDARINAGVLDWAEAGNTAAIPADKLANQRFTAVLETKLAGIADEAQPDLTAAEIVTLLTALAGAARLPASAVRDLPAAPTGAVIVGLLEGLAGDARLQASAIRGLTSGGGTPRWTLVVGKTLQSSDHEAEHSFTGPESTSIIAALSDYDELMVTWNSGSVQASTRIPTLHLRNTPSNSTWSQYMRAQGLFNNQDGLLQMHINTSPNPSIVSLSWVGGEKFINNDALRVYGLGS